MKNLSVLIRYSILVSQMYRKVDFDWAVRTVFSSLLIIANWFLRFALKHKPNPGFYGFPQGALHYLSLYSLLHDLPWGFLARKLQRSRCSAS